MLSVLLFSNLFPNPEQPLRGNFVENLLLEMRKMADIHVISPLPWFPANVFPQKLKHINSDWCAYSKIPGFFDWKGFEVYYPRYPFIPVISRIFHPVLMALAVFGLVRELVREKKIDIINSHWIYPDAIAAAWIGKRLKIPVVATAHGSDINIYGNYKWRRPQIRWALNNSENVVTVSKALSSNVVKNLDFNSDKVSVIPNGVDVRKFYPLSREDARSKLGLKRNGKYVLFVGRLHEVKGLSYLFQALGILKKRNALSFETILLGDGPLLSDLMKQVDSLGIKDRVVFKGAKPNSELPLWMNACNVLCLPSIWEGQPCVILESLACGTPVAASRVGGIPELIDESNGMLSEPENPSSIAEALEECIRKSWNSTLIAEKMKGFSWESSAHAYIALFDRVVKSRKRNVVNS